MRAAKGGGSHRCAPRKPNASSGRLPHKVPSCRFAHGLNKPGWFPAPASHAYHTKLPTPRRCARVALWAASSSSWLGLVFGKPPSHIMKRALSGSSGSPGGWRSLALSGSAGLLFGTTSSLELAAVGTSLEVFGGGGGGGRKQPLFGAAKACHLVRRLGCRSVLQVENFGLTVFLLRVYPGGGVL